ncbi:MAG: hypothetical protein K8S97_06920 [Anaerolineae bacterium]|nr:hypothetical protein [Anaerolineae bacterium]
MGRHLYVLIFALISVVFMLVGGFVGLVEGPRQDREARHIDNLPDLTYDQLATQSPGTEVALTGTLVDNGSRANDEYGVTGLELVAYEVHEWDVYTDSDGDVSGSWDLLYRDIASLAMQFGSGIVTVERDDSAAGITLDGALYETITREGSGNRSAMYDGRSYPDGSWRVRGFRNGDQITVLGAISASGGVTPDQLYAGTRADLVADLRNNARFLRLFGLVFGGIGAILGVVALVIFVRRR